MFGATELTVLAPHQLLFLGSIHIIISQTGGSGGFWV
jgi:hypothetical protein